MLASTVSAYISTMPTVCCTFSFFKNFSQSSTKFRTLRKNIWKEVRRSVDTIRSLELSLNHDGQIGSVLQQLREMSFLCISFLNLLLLLNICFTLSARYMSVVDSIIFFSCRCCLWPSL